MTGGGWKVEPRGDYPRNWFLLRWKFYKLADYRCEHCGMSFKPGTVKAVDARRRDGKEFILTCHHINGDRADCSIKNVVVVCQACHLHIQGLWSPGGVLPLVWGGQVPGWITRRKLPYIDHPQNRMKGF